MVTITINIPPMLAYIYIPYMDPMGMCIYKYNYIYIFVTPGILHFVQVSSPGGSIDMASGGAIS
jgi:hypothetical protein